MATNVTLLPFRQYAEENVINLFRWSGAVPCNKGTLVTITSGWVSDRNDIDFLGPVGQGYANTVSERYGVRPYVAAATTGDTGVLGMLLYDVKETDENGEKYIYRKDKLQENDIVLSGQAVPLVTRGVFLHSGITDGIPSVNAPLYASGGTLIVTQPLTILGNCVKVGKCLGAKDINGWTLIKLEL